MMWQPRADHEQKQEPGDVTITRGLDATRPITEELLWWIIRVLLWRVPGPEGTSSATAGAEERDDRGAYRGEARLRRRADPVFFPVSPLRVAGSADRGRRSCS